MNRILSILVTLLSVVFLTSCYQGADTSEESVSGSLFSEDGSGGGSPGGGDSGGTTVTLNSAIYGSVSNSVVESSSASSPPLLSPSGSLLVNSNAPVYASSNACLFSDFNVYRVGDDGTPISSGTSLGGYFKADVDEDHEVIIEFSCGMKCLGKPGTSALVCDLVANAVINALENSLGTSIKSDSNFNGLSVAKIAEGVGESLKLISKLDATNSLTDKLQQAADATTMKNIIMSSSLGPLFNSVATMAQEKQAYNQAIALGDSTDEALTKAAAASWTVEKVVDMMTGIGLPISLDFDGEMSLYSELFSNMDEMAKVPFVSGLKTYTENLYTSINNNETSNVVLVCIGYKSNTDPITYPPYEIDGKLTCYDTLNYETDAMGLTKNNGADKFDNNTWITTQIKPSADEPNRNDPNGTHSNYYGGIQDYSISVVRAYPEFMEKLQDSTADGGCYEYANWSGDELSGFFDGFFPCVVGLDMGDYFSGLIGILKFMRDKDRRKIKFSLDDIYQAIVGSNYMSIRPTTNVWQIGIDGSDVKINFTDNNDSVWMSPYLLFEDGSADGRPRFDLELTDGTNGGPDLSNGDVTTDINTFLALLNSPDYIPSYDALMKDFENIPSMEEIKDWIFKSSHFEPYNVAGPKKFYVMGNLPASGNSWEADAPIMCRIYNPNEAGDFVSGQSAIQCYDASDVSWDSNGYADDPSDQYSSYYALVDRAKASSEDQSDRYYALLNIHNGTEYMLNGREFRIRGINQLYGNPEPGSLTIYPNPSNSAQTLKKKSLEFCEPREVDGVMKEYCWTEVFSSVALEFSNDWYRSDSYWPYTTDVDMTYEYWDNATETTVTQTYQMPIAFTLNNTSDTSDDYAVCLKGAAVATGAYSWQVADVTIDSNSFVDCFDNEESTFYYLSPEWGADTSADQKYFLVSNNNDYMWADTTADVPIVLSTLTGALGKNLGPAGIASWMNGFQIANLGHDPKFDPYCDDRDNNGQCNCNDVDEDGRCTLEDTYLEPTLSDPPYWIFDSSADMITGLIDACRGQDGSGLQSCVSTYGSNVNILNLWVDWSKLMECTNTSKTVSWVNIDAMVNDSSPSTVNYGQGCGTASNGFMGEVRMKNLIKRRNAYDVERPNKMLKLISTATSTTGTGVPIGRYDKVFNFQEALAMAYLRLVMPMDAKVFKDGNLQEDIKIYFDMIKIPGKDMGLASGLLRKFLEEGGVIPEVTP